MLPTGRSPLVLLPGERRSANSEALRRANLVRTIAGVLAFARPVPELWPRCCAALLLLAGSSRVAVVLRGPEGEATAYDSGTGPSDASNRNWSIPIRFGIELLGELLFEGAAPDDPELLSLLASCGLFIGARLQHERAGEPGEAALSAGLPATDQITGAAHLSRFEAAIALEWSRATREQSSLSVAILDLDRFKLFNDAYGHQAGDLCLRQAANALGSVLGRPADVFARYGGESFVALLPATDLEGGIAVGERFRAALQTLGIVNGGAPLGHLTTSVGVAAMVPRPGTSHEQLIRAADDALSQAKRDGRDRVVARGYASAAAPAPRERLGRPNNLPLYLTRLIGRRAETEQVRQLLEENRLVSVVGLGGSGKTRVALHVAAEFLDRAPDGAWFVDLAPLSNAAFLASKIAAALGANVRAEADAVDDLVRAIGSRDVLLVLDNCEHVIDAAANIVAGLVRGCPCLRVLTTSREPLGITGETVYRLPLLEAPPVRSSATAASIAKYDAVALFVERARAVNAAFTLTDKEAPLVAEICRRLDGVALAIELAASRLSGIGLGTLARRLKERFRILTGGDRSALPRQQTLRAMLDWSYELLSGEERIVLRRLAIFAGGFDLEAASAVCGQDVLEPLSALVRKSLVVENFGEIAARYNLLETTKDYAAEKLRDANESDAVARAHAQWFLGVARGAQHSFYTAPSRQWRTLLLPDFDNFRQALEWALSPGGDTELGAALAAAVAPYIADVVPSEVTRWMRRALQALGENAPAALEAPLLVRLVLTPRNLPADELRRAAERAVALCRELGDPYALSEALGALSQTLVWFCPGERELASRSADESLALARSLQDPIRIAMSLRIRTLTLDADDLLSRRAALAESIALFRRYGSARFVGSVLTWLSELEFAAGERSKAFEIGREAVRFAEESGSVDLILNTMTNLAQYAAAANDRELARRAAESAFELARETGTLENQTWSVQALAFVSHDERRYGAAARLLGFCDARAGSVHAPRQHGVCDDILHRELVAKLRARLGDAEYEAAAAAGASLSADEALAEALGS
jgi:diguanylate cyclase (GGDEF)-like protein